MKIGCIGAGHIGGTLARLWAASGHSVFLSSRHPQNPDMVISRITGISIRGSVEEAAEFGAVILLAIPLGGIVETAPRIATFLDGKVVLDAMNPFRERDGTAALDVFRRKIASGKATQERFPNSRVVRAFSTVPYTDLQSRAHDINRPVSIPFAGDETGAKQTARHLIRDAGFEPFDIGGLDESTPLDPGGVLFGKALDRGQIAERLQRQTV